jgi:hypothetical protein
MSPNSGRTTVQLVALFVERKMLLAPAKRFVPETAKEVTAESVKPAAVQLAPLFVERNTPENVPAKRLVSMTARDEISTLAVLVSGNRN